MRNDSETHKSEWIAPDFEVIAFRDTRGGGPDAPPEDTSYNDEASPE